MGTTPLVERPVGEDRGARASYPKEDGMVGSLGKLASIVLVSVANRSPFASFSRSLYLSGSLYLALDFALI